MAKFFQKSGHLALKSPQEVHTDGFSLDIHLCLIGKESLTLSDLKGSAGNLTRLVP